MKNLKGFALVLLILFLSCPIAKTQSGSCSLKTSIKRQENTSNVYNDLLKLGIDTSKYSTSSTAEMVTLAESETGQLFVYIFDKSIKYDSIDISYSFDPASEKFVKYKLSQVDFENNITKYLVSGLKSDMTLKKRRYAVRQVYDSKSKNKIEGIIPVALEYLLETDSSGNVPAENPEDNLNFFERILRAFKRVFTNKDIELVDYFYFGVGLVGSIVILAVLVKFVKLIIKLF